MNIEDEIKEAQAKLAKLEKAKAKAKKLDEEKQKIEDEVDEEKARVAELQARLSDVLAATRMQLARERQMTNGAAALAQQIRQMQVELASQQGTVGQLRNQLQQNLAAALYPIVANEYKHQQKGNGLLDDLEQHKRVTEEVSKRCNKLLAQLMEGE